MRDRLRQADEVQAGRKHRPDYWLLLVGLALLSIGVIVVYSISPALGKAHNLSDNYFITKQAIAIGLGALAFFITSRIPLRLWQRYTIPLLAVAALATVVAVVTPAPDDYHAHRWIRLGGFSFQSVELLKFALLMWLSSFLGARMRSGTITDFGLTTKPFLTAFAVIGVVIAGVQSDLGSMVVIIAIMGLMAAISGLPLRRLVLIGLAVALLGIAAISTTQYRRDRLATFVHPTADCQTAGYQACQALKTVGSGGLLGKGVGRGVQAYGYLPEAANDSIFAIYAEKFGFVGVTVLLAIFAVFFYRLKRLVERAADHTSQLIVAGVLAWLATQTLINIGGMLGLLPLKGITLPLVSYGGTSVVFIMAALGVVYQISKFASYAPQEQPAPSRPGYAPGGAPGVAALSRRSMDGQRTASPVGRRRFGR